MAICHANVNIETANYLPFVISPEEFVGTKSQPLAM